MNFREANLKKTIWKLASGLHSLSEAGAIANARYEMGSNVDPAVHDGMMNAITTLYCRPFTDNAGVGMVSEKIARNLSEDAKSSHAFILMHRNITGAHSDATVRFSDDDRLIRDLTLTVTKLPDEGTGIGHTLPLVRLDFSHLAGFIILIGEMIELFRASLDENIGHLYWDEEKNVALPTLPDISKFEVGESVSFNLNLHEAIEYTKEDNKSEMATPRKPSDQF